MNQNLQAALAFLLGAASALGVQQALIDPVTALPKAVRVVNARLIRESNVDGGYGWAVRACGYVMEADGGHSLEPCWEEHVDSPGVQSLELALLLAAPVVDAGAGQ